MYHFIVNPASKSGKGIKIWKELVKELEKRGVEYKEYLTQGTGDAARFAHEIELECGDEESHIVLLGGDGTLNEMIQDIAHPEKMYIGYIPTGSSNDFARDVKISTDPLTALDNILTKKNPVTFDIGEVTYNAYDESTLKCDPSLMKETRRFMVSCGIGFDAGICEEAMDSRMKDFLNKIKLGKLTYAEIALHQVKAAGSANCEFSINGETPKKAEKLIFIVGMNTRYEGGGFMFCPNAKPNDGTLDVCLVNGIGTMGVVKALLPASNGNHTNKKGVSMYKATTLNVKVTEPLWVHTDGEVLVKATDITMCCNKYKTTMYI